MMMRTLRALAASALSAALLATGGAQAAPWFGQGLPPPINDPTKPILPVKDDLPPQPAAFGPGPKSPLLTGERIKADVVTIVGFSLESRAAGDYLWGRMSGAPAYYKTARWAVDELRKGGLADAHLEDFPAALSTPLSGEARILGDPSFGGGTQDIVLQSAIVGGRGPVNGVVTAPLIYVGHASSADLLGRDIQGKIAVIHSLPDPGLFGAPEVGRPAALMRAGAVGVIEILDQIGNMQSYDGDRHGCGVQLCFTVGGADGFFLENMLGKAGLAGKTVSARLSATSALRTGLKTANGVATLPGNTGRTIIINAHADAFFVGADDNASGLATELALARYFARRPKLAHTLVFVVSAGHHSQGMGLPDFRLRHEADDVSRADLIINLEHLSNLGVVRDLTMRQGDNFGAQMVATTTEFPKAVAVSNRAPFLIDLWRQGAKCFGLSIQRVVDTVAPGELGAFTMIEGMAGRNPKVDAAKLKNVDIPVTQMISSGPLFHTSGETVDAVPAPGLERAARFYAYMILAADAAAPRLLRGASWTPRAKCPATP